MSVNFFIKGERLDMDTEDNYINLCNSNAMAVLEWLGYPVNEDLYGELDPEDLAARCRRRLWPEFHRLDKGVLPTQDGRLINCGRRPGYLIERTEQLLELAQRAAGRKVMYG